MYNGITKQVWRWKMDVYVDLLFLINFSMDYICLYITVKILHQKIKLSRMVWAAAVGGVYSVISLFLPFSAPLELDADVLIGLALCFIAFGGRDRPIKRVLLYGFLFVGVSMAVGGCMTAIFNMLSRLDIPTDLIPADSPFTYLFAVIAAIAGIVSLAGGRIISRRTTIKKCRIKLKFCNQSFELDGLCDSGNLVRDPISHKPVIFVDRGLLEKKIDLGFLDEYAKGRFSSDFPAKSLRLIIIETAAGRSTLVAAAPEEIYISRDSDSGSDADSGISPDCLIAPTQITQTDDGYRAIVPQEIIKGI
jgi:sigma-E processing peptidase SpoIIGA